eukprot:gene35827-43454_t
MYWITLSFYIAVCLCLWSHGGIFAEETAITVTKPAVGVAYPSTAKQQENPSQPVTVTKPAAVPTAASTPAVPKPAPAAGPVTAPTPVAAPVTKPAPVAASEKKTAQPTSTPSMMFQAPSLETVNIATHKPTHTAQTHKDLPTVSPIFAKHTPTLKPVFADEKNAAAIQNEIEEEDEEAASATHYIFVFVFLLAIGSVLFYMCKRARNGNVLNIDNHSMRYSPLRTNEV